MLQTAQTILSSGDFWIGQILSPLTWYLAWITLKWISRCVKVWRIVFRGLPFVQYPMMAMMYLGSRYINRKHCKFMTYEGRWWFSPNMPAFTAPVDQPDQRF